MSSTTAASARDLGTIVATQAFFTALAVACDTDVAQIETALATLVALELDADTLDNFQTVQDDARRAAGRCRATIAVLDARHGQLEEAVNATPDAARSDFYRDGAARLDRIRHRAMALAAAAGDPAEVPGPQAMHQDAYRGQWGWNGQHADRPNQHTAGQVEVDSWEQLVAFAAATMGPFRELTFVQHQWPRRILTFRPDGSVTVDRSPMPWSAVRPEDFATAAEALIGSLWDRDTPQHWSTAAAPPVADANTRLDADPDPEAARSASAEPTGSQGTPAVDTAVDAELREALLRDDADQERGMPADERETCPDCRTWTGEEHVESADHRAQIASTTNPRLARQTRDRYASIADPQLREALVRDDLAEDYGMHADERETCHGCRTWASDEHLDSPQHQALLGARPRYGRGRQ